jgi:hypothetical protein
MIKIFKIALSPGMILAATESSMTLELVNTSRAKAPPIV